MLQSNLNAFLIVNFLAVASADMLCTNTPNWVDTAGQDCTHYVDSKWCNADGTMGIGWNPIWGTFKDYAVNGLDATNACCGCGKSGCVDIPGWRDADNDTCAVYVNNHYCTNGQSYGQGWASSWGTFEDYAVNGIEAVEACCGCGRGGFSQLTSYCDINHLYEYSSPQRCQVAQYCEDEPSLCASGTSSPQSLHMYKLDACVDAGKEGYNIAVAYNPVSSAGTAKVCLILNVGDSVVVLSLPHRIGSNVDCGAYCTTWCDNCHHIDLSFALPQESVDFQVESSSYSMTYTWDSSCDSTDQYNLVGPAVKYFGLPSFSGDDSCVLGSTLLSPGPSPSPLLQKCPPSDPTTAPCIHASPSPEPTPSPSRIRRSAATSRSPSQSRSPSPKASRSPSRSRSPRPSPTPSPSPMPSPSLSPDSSPSVSPEDSSVIRRQRFEQVPSVAKSRSQSPLIIGAIGAASLFATVLALKLKRAPRVIVSDTGITPMPQ